MYGGGVLDIPEDRSSSSTVREDSKQPASAHEVTSKPFELDILKPFLTARGVAHFLSREFNMNVSMVKQKLEEMWVSLKISVFQVDESVIGSTVDLF